jgi:hypothetical protein
VTHLRRLAVAAALLAMVAACGSAPSRPSAGISANPSALPGSSANAGPSGSANPSASAGPSVSAGPSAAASPKPSKKPLPNGKPSASTTGVPPGVTLKRVDGNRTYTTAGQVIQNVDIHGYVTVKAKNVVIRNAIIRGGAARCNAAVVNVASSGSVTIERSEIVPSHPNACLDGIWATNATLRRLNIHGVVDGIKANDNVLLEDSYIHDLSWYASDPNQGGGPTHNDDVQTLGSHHITLRRNVLLAYPKGNAAYQVTQDFGATGDLHIENNWLDGGGCTLNFAHNGGPTPMTGIYVVGNRFGRHSEFQCPILVSTLTQLSANSGNVWDDTGKPIPAPQRHD